MQLADTVDQGERQGWVACYVATVVAMMAIQASSLGFSPLIPFMKESWGMSYTQMGTFTGLYGIVALIMSLPAGLLAKRYGEKPVLSVGLLLATVGLLLVALAESYAQGLVARTLWLIGYRLAFICVVTAVAVTVPTRWRGNAMGLVGALTALATIMGSGFSSHMQVSVGWRPSMVGFAALTLIAAAYFMYFYRPAKLSGVRAATTRPGTRPGQSGLFSAFKIPIVWTIPLLGLANAGGFAATFFVPSVVRAEFHGGPAMSSTIIAAAYSLAIVVNPLCGWLADRLDRWLVMAAMSAVMIPACILMSSRNVYVFGLATALLVALGHAAANQVYPTAAGLLRGRDTGPIMGIVGLGSGIFGYLGPQALGWLRDYSGGFDLGWRVVMCTTIGILLLLLQLKRYADAHPAAELIA
jgi:predicted MFS family arabinose efflux permease